MNPPDLATALADCLARGESGEAPEQALARYPHLRPALDELVAAAGAVRALPARPPRPAFRDALAGELARLSDVPGPSAPPRPAWGPGPIVLAAAVLLGLAALAGPAQRWLSAGSSVGTWLARPGQVASRAPLAGLASAADATRVLRLLAPPRPTAAGSRPTTLAAGLPADPGQALGGAGRSAVGAILPTHAAITPPPTATPPAATDTPAPDAAGPTPADTASPPTDTASPPPTGSPTATAAQPAQAAHAAGGVKQGDMPLAGLTVELYAHGDLADNCATEPVTTPIAVATTDAAGRFDLPGVAPGWYRLSARGGPLCLPRRWHTGENSPAAPDPCAAVAFGLTDSQVVDTLNVLIEVGVGGCP